MATQDSSEERRQGTSPVTESRPNYQTVDPGPTRVIGVFRSGVGRILCRPPLEEEVAQLRASGKLSI